jgi:hypothetical protein
MGREGGPPYGQGKRGQATPVNAYGLGSRTVNRDVISWSPAAIANVAATAAAVAAVLLLLLLLCCCCCCCCCMFLQW